MCVRLPARPTSYPAEGRWGAVVLRARYGQNGRPVSRVMTLAISQSLRTGRTGTPARGRCAGVLRPEMVMGLTESVVIGSTGPGQVRHGGSERRGRARTHDLSQRIASWQTSRDAPPVPCTVHRHRGGPRKAVAAPFPRRGFSGREIVEEEFTTLEAKKYFPGKPSADWRV